MTRGQKEKITVFCAGPAYYPEEKAGMEELAAMLEGSGYSIYLPHRDGMEKLLYREKTEGTPHDPDGRLAEAVFALNLFQVTERCRCLVMNLNGRVPDEGGLFITSLAFATGKPLVLYKKDHRTTFHGGDNSMITGLTHAFSTVNRLDKIPAALERAIKVISSYGRNDYNKNTMHTQYQESLEKGRMIWELLWNGKYAPEQAALYDKILEIIDGYNIWR